MGRRVQPEPTPAGAAEQMERRFRQIDKRLGILLLVATERGGVSSDHPSMADLRAEVEAMRKAAAKCDDPGERVRLAVECARSIRPRWLARAGEIDGDPRAVFPEYKDAP